MKYTHLPNTDIKVSKICLGSMTWGEQNTEEDGHAQLDYALSEGVNFIDTAELYSVPNPRAATYGNTERIIGSWLKKNKNRDQVIIASKIAGPAAFTKHIRTSGFAKKGMETAINDSLSRMGTDYIDLYQLHWPERNTNFFGKLGYSHDEKEEWEDNFAETLESLNTFIKAGKIRQIGLSNESPYGLSRYLEEARKGAPKMITVQNPYSLLNRKDEIGLAEILMRQEVGLLPYSPLGFGMLTGKYLEEYPEDGRVTIYPNYNRYHNENCFAATRLYKKIADEYGLSLTQMSLAYVNTRPFVTSNIIGATSVKQLAENIESINVDLSDEILKAIEAVHKDIPNPAP